MTRQRFFSVGLVLGLVASLGLTRYLASQLWGVSVTDPWTYGIVFTCVISVGLASCLAPARRATWSTPW